MASISRPQSQPECPLCGGTGWKTVEVPGKASQVRRCECRIDARAEQLLRAANLPLRYQHCTLADFDTDFPGAPTSLAKAKVDAEGFIKAYPSEKAGLLLTGPVGTGKTHLAVGIIQELIRKLHSCLFCDYRDLLKQIQNSYNPQVQVTELEILRPVFDAEVLVLDELGATRPSEWVWDTVSYILNYRYNEKKTTIITTNFPNLPSQKETGKQHSKPRRVSRTQEDTDNAEAAMREETLGDRITDSMRSRLLEMCRVVQMDGVDFRQQFKSASFNKG